VIVGVQDACARQAKLTFAMARHTAVDLAQVLGRAPVDASQDRLPAPELARLRAGLAATGVVVAGGGGADDKLAELRRMYEPFVAALSEYLMMPLPAWRVGASAHENWRATAWGQTPDLPDERF
jgi:hypothetical protein